MNSYQIWRLEPNASAWRLLPNRWDFIAFPLIIGLIAMAAIGFEKTLAPLSTLSIEAISLNPIHLPEYALRTTLRMLAAMVAALLFTLIYGTLAAKNKRAEKILIPILDILQSVPVLGYISFTVTLFLALAPGRVIGAECAAIFAIFTSQAWNMTFSFYQSLKTVPRDLEEVSKNFQLTSWQRFWKLDVPFSMPGLVWNMMMSMSGGWFFVVAAEAITVGNQSIMLPGVGTYLSQAIAMRDLGAIGWVIITMLLVILLYDQLLFRPLVAWIDKFRFETTSGQKAPQSWLLDLIHHTRLIRQLLLPIGWTMAFIARIPIRFPERFLIQSKKSNVDIKVNKIKSKVTDWIWAAALIIVTLYLVIRIFNYATQNGLGINDVINVFSLGFLSLLRVTILIIIASLIWVPIGVIIGLRPALAEKIQPIVQFLAAFPANLFFPVFVIVIVHFNLNPHIWLSPLIILGTQWYILFNVIAGASAYPNDFREVALNFKIKGWQWWRQFILPGIFPYYITGAITAFGGAWNATIVAEAVSWGDTHLTARGLGSYIAEMTIAGDYARILLGIIVMSLFVMLFNRLLWRPLYKYAEDKLRF